MGDGDCAIAVLPLTPPEFPTAELRRDRELQFGGSIRTMPEVEGVRVKKIPGRSNQAYGVRGYSFAVGDFEGCPRNVSTA